MRRAALAGIVLGAALLVAAPVAPALAHNYPIAETPEEGSTIDAQPEVVTLTTNDELLAFEDTASMDVIGPDGRHYATACATVSGATVEVPALLGAPGAYTTEWRAVSADGHPISGEFAFTWAPADGVQLAEGADEAVCPSAGGGSTDAAADSTDATDATDADDASTDAAASGATADLLWVLGALGVVAVAGVVTWLAVRRRGGSGPDRHDPHSHDAGSRDAGSRDAGSRDAVE